MLIEHHNIVLIKYTNVPIFDTVPILKLPSYATKYVRKHKEQILIFEFWLACLIIIFICVPEEKTMCSKPGAHRLNFDFFLLFLIYTLSHSAFYWLK